jgi:hypothetical protein
VIYRHFIAPSRGYTPFAHDVIRHPRLTPEAHRILTWQLSLPTGAKETLARTAEKCGIGATAFTRAKRQLIAEGYVHERRLQGAGGRWSTRQMVSSVPLKAGEAAKIMAAMPVGEEGAVRVFPQVAPSAPHPAAGSPGGRPADGHPLGEDLKEKIPNRPSGPSGSKPEPDPEPEPEPEPQREPQREPEAEPVPPEAELSRQARELVEALPRLTPDLCGIPVAMRRELTALTLRWLEAGHGPGDVRTHLLRGMPTNGSPVLRPGGLVRYLLREVPPLRAATPAGPGRPATAAGPPSPSLAAAFRECEGEHDTVTVFRPRHDESLCPRCLAGITGRWQAGPGSYLVDPGHDEQRSGHAGQQRGGRHPGGDALTPHDPGAEPLVQVGDGPQ